MLFRSSELNLLRATVARLEIGMTAGILTVDQTGQIVNANPTICEMSGWRKEDLVGQSVRIMVPFRFRRAHEQGLREARDGKPLRDEPIETFLYTQTGLEIPVRVALSQWDEAGQRLYGAEIRRRTV